MKRFALSVMVATLLLGGASPSFAVSPDVVVSQVYGGGGNSGATLTNDFIELYNRGSATVDLTGWSVQYGSASGTTYQVTSLSGSIEPAGYYLVQEARGAGGVTPLPTPDATGTIAMGATAGKVAVVTATTALACGADCDDAPGVRDFVGYGTANDFEGAAAAPGLTNTTAALRAGAGAIDTDSNASDFASGAPNPRNSGFVPPPPPPAAGCDVAATREVADVQGSGAATPIPGQQVRVEGVVTGDFNGSGGLGGFFLQDDTPDHDPATSDGIFAASLAPVEVGDFVRVNGTAAESFGLTQLSVSAVDVCGTGTISPQSYDLPRPSGVTFEPVESMLLAFPETLTVTEHFQLGRFGELTVSSDGRLFQPTDRVAPGAPATAMLDLNNRRRLLIDDGSNVQNPPTIPFASPGNVVRIGDTTSAITGVLSFGFGRYRLEPTAPISFARTNPRPAAPDPVGGDIRVASFNTLNYFTTIDDGVNDARGADSPEEFERQQAKEVAAIAAIDADVIGLMEVENNGATAVESLVDALNAEVGPGTYAFVAEPVLNPPNSFGGTFGVDAIKVALIYRPAVVAPIGSAQSTSNPIFDRPPLIQTFQLVGGSEAVTLAVNHFKSKNCGAGDPLDADQGDGQSCFNHRRTLQAEALVALLATLDVPNALVIGDLNSYSEEDPIDTLEMAGYTGISEAHIDDASRYSFVFDGHSGELDHALAAPSLQDNVSGAAIWHINADETVILDYNLEFNPVAFYEPNAYRSSDHDPLIVGLSLCETTAPTLSVSASPSALHPPNHKYRRVTTTLAASDNSGAAPPVTLVSVTSNEPDNAPGGGDGNTTDDIVIVNHTTFDLRAERDENESGRIYTITYRATDACGNATIESATVTVPIRP